jgi:hypothetical protein
MLLFMMRRVRMMTPPALNTSSRGASTIQVMLTCMLCPPLTADMRSLLTLQGGHAGRRGA